MRIALFKFCIYFVAIIFLGIWLAQIGGEIGRLGIWSESFVGTTFLVIVTSLPELVVSLASLKFTVSMAVGNILGSNFLDMMIIPFCDILCRKEEFLSSISPNHLLSYR